MNIDISKGFELGAFHFDIETSDKIDKELIGRNRYGECSTQGQVIRISGDYPKDQYSNTFLHECLEAVNSVYCNDGLNHKHITNTANGLAQILKSLGISFVYGKTNKEQE